MRAGLYGFVRHPIYALGIALMLCSVVAIPTLSMIVLALMHFPPFMAIKARSEGRFLRDIHGEGYIDYYSPHRTLLPSFALS